MRSVEQLEIYKKSLRFVHEIYQIIRNNPQLQKDYSLCDQIKRSSISVATNISEGYCRSKKQCKNYLRISSGSANETITLLTIIKLIYKIDISLIAKEYEYLAKQISAFSNSF